MGETVENVGRNIDTYSYRQPLGVCAGITPFNFPGTSKFYSPRWGFSNNLAGSDDSFVDVSYRHHLWKHIPSETF